MFQHCPLGFKLRVAAMAYRAFGASIPAPVRFKSSAVPTDHSVWPDNCQCIIDIGKQSADPSQYQSVNREKWEFLGTSPPQHIELLPQNQNLCLKRSSRPKQIDQHPEDKSAQIHHQASASSDSQSIASRNGFTVGTGGLFMGSGLRNPSTGTCADRRHRAGALE